MIALHLLGYPVDHPVMQAGLAGLDRFSVWDDGRRRLEACQSPVWDTALAVVAIERRRGDVERRAPRPRRPLAARRGDRRRAATGPSGGPTSRPAAGRSSSRTTTIPTSTTRPRSCSPSIACRAVDPDRVQAAIDRAVCWINGMQCRDGGWGAFDVDNDSRLIAELPFCDFGAVTDPPSADVTAHVVEMLGQLAATGGSDAVDADVLARGLAWLSAEQERDGSWFGRWGANHVYGTGAAVPALVAAGVARGGRAGRGGGALARSGAERRRRVGRGPAVVRRRQLAWPWRVDAVADRVGAARPDRGTRLRTRPPGAASPGSSSTSAPTARGTSRTSPAPGSRATSTSTTTCTAWCSR